VKLLFGAEWLSPVWHKSNGDVAVNFQAIEDLDKLIVILSGCLSAMCHGSFSWSPRTRHKDTNHCIAQKRAQGRIPQGQR
jgi:hypothetical protein